MTITAVVTDVHEDNGTTKVVTWTSLTSTDPDGSPVKLNPWGDRTVQVLGTAGAGTIKFEGSNDGTNWEILNDVANTAISYNALGMYAVEQIPLYVRPNISGADGSTDITVIMAARRANQSRQ